MKRPSFIPVPPPLLRYLALHGVIGVLTGCAVAALLLITDAVGFGTLVAGSDHPVLVAALLFFGFAVTFGSVMMGSAIVLLEE